MLKNHQLLSTLAIYIEGYIAEKRAVGYKFAKGADILKRFDSFVNSRNLMESILTKQLVMEWTVRKPNETISTQCGRISLLRGLAEYMNHIGCCAYIYPRSMVTMDRYSYIPYIFSDDEIRRIFEICDHYPPQDSSPTRHLVLPLLIRMLYGCGLRISEALNLTQQDVDLHRGTLYIRHTKFNKERILPMADSLTEYCQKYSRSINIVKMGNPFFFPSPFNGHYSEGTIYCLFRKVLWQAQISHLGRGKGPRIHDFRHIA